MMTTQVEWPDLMLLNTYAPNNGKDYTSFERRREWDTEALKFAEAMHGMPLVWIGDFNATLEDADVTEPVARTPTAPLLHATGRWRKRGRRKPGRRGRTVSRAWGLS